MSGGRDPDEKDSHGVWRERMICPQPGPIPVGARPRRPRVHAKLSAVKRSMLKSGLLNSLTPPPSHRPYSPEVSSTPAWWFVWVYTESYLCHELMTQRIVCWMNLAKASVTPEPFDGRFLEDTGAARDIKGRVHNLPSAFDGTVFCSYKFYHPRMPMIDAIRPVLGDCV